MHEWFYYEVCPPEENHLNQETYILWQSEDELDGSAVIGCFPCVEQSWEYKNMKSK